MRYSEARKLIASGDILAFRRPRLTLHPRTWFGNLISIWTRSAYSHVGIAIWVDIPEIEDHSLFCLEALEGQGVRMHQLSDYVNRRGSRIDVFRTYLLGWPGGNMARISRKSIVRYAVSRLGNRYASPRQLLRSFSRTGRAIRRLFGLSADHDPSREFCSELVGMSLLAGGMPLSDLGLKTPSELTPGDITELPCLKFRCDLEPDDDQNDPISSVDDALDLMLCSRTGGSQLRPSPQG